MAKHDDYYHVDDLLTEEHRLIRSTIRQHVEKYFKPYLEDLAQGHTYKPEWMKVLGDTGVLGPTIPAQYGGMGADYITYGIMMQELERGDSAIRSAASVQGSLAMYAIYKYGSEEQKMKYLPGMVKGEVIGCYGLTEPNHGSNPSGMETRIRRTPNGYVVSGSKMWITNSPIADIAVVWAKNEAGRIKGVLLEKGMKGFTAPEIHHKWSLRAGCTGELVMDEVEVIEEHILPLADGLSAPLSCLDQARYGIAWGAIGAAQDCYDTALKYSLERIQFDKPIASFQLVQKKLAELLTEIVKAQLLTWRLGVLKNENRASTALISMAKRNNVAMALNTARECRQILGAMGVTGDFGIMRHMMNLESVITYEGTHDIHLLITGHDVTGISAIKG